MASASDGLQTLLLSRNENLDSYKLQAN